MGAARALTIATLVGGIGMTMAMGAGAAAAAPANQTPDAGVYNGSICSNTPGVVDNSAGCIQGALSQINAARAQDGVKPMTLPANYASLSAAQQLQVVIGRERTDRGLSGFGWTTAQLNGAAAEGADSASDPQISAPTYAGSRWQETSIEAGDISQALVADYFWMYADGWGGSPEATFNVDCTSPTASGCWDHRDAILFHFTPGEHLSIGSAVQPNGPDGQPVWAVLMAGTAGTPR